MSRTPNLHPQAIETNFRLVPVSPNTYAIVSPEDYPSLCNYSWRLVQARWNTYAKADYTKDGKKHTISMHRLIAKTPYGQVCHHINRRTLDNRRQNLRNMDKMAHKMLHTTDKLTIRFELIDKSTADQISATPTIEKSTHAAPISIASASE